MRIAVIGPHPDDQELAMGGSILRFVRSGHQVTLVDMTSGEPTPFGTPEIRAAEAQKAAEMLGVQRVAVGLVNRQVLHDLPSRHALAAVYRQLRPELVFLPYPVDAHPDHLAVTRVGEDARFDAKLTKSCIPGEPWYPGRILYYFASHLRFNFPATFALDISEEMESKQAAIRCYQSQFFTGRSGRDSGAVLDYVSGINRYFGGMIRREFAEPFWSQELLGFSGLGELL